MPKAPLVSYWTVMAQTVLGKFWVISLFVTLYVLRQVQMCPSRSSFHFYRARTREARANLAELANFPTLRNTMRPDGTWAVAQNEYDQTDSVRDSQPSVRVSRLRLLLILRRTHPAFHFSRRWRTK